MRPGDAVFSLRSFDEVLAIGGPGEFPVAKGARRIEAEVRRRFACEIDPGGAVVGLRRWLHARGGWGDLTGESHIDTLNRVAEAIAQGRLSARVLPVVRRKPASKADPVGAIRVRRAIERARGTPDHLMTALPPGVSDFAGPLVPNGPATPPQQHRFSPPHQRPGAAPPSPGLQRGRAGMSQAAAQHAVFPSAPWVGQATAIAAGASAAAQAAKGATLDAHKTETVAPVPIHPEFSARAATQQAAGPPAAGSPPAPPAKPPSAMEPEEKFQQVLLRCVKHMPADIAAEFTGLLIGLGLTRVAAIIAAWAASHAFAVGFLVDALLLIGLGVGILLAGASIYEGGKLLYRAVTETLGAKTEADLENASKTMAQAITMLGVAVLSALLTRGTKRGNKGGTGKKSKNVPPDAPSNPPPRQTAPSFQTSREAVKTSPPKTPVDTSPPKKQAYDNSGPGPLKAMVFEHLSPEDRIKFAKMLPPEKQRELTKLLPKKERLDPELYMTKEQISSHLDRFKDGGGFFVTEDAIMNPAYKSFPKDKFIMPKKELQRIADDFKKTGDRRALEDALGYETGSLENAKIFVVEVPPNPNVRFPKGNESGANHKWEPGGFTSGGLPEATMQDFKMHHGNSIETLMKNPGVSQL